jgi:hypothetical protein
MHGKTLSSSPIFETPSDAIAASSWRTASTSGEKTTDGGGHRSLSDLVETIIEKRGVSIALRAIVL